jgi:hypothetical protein
MNLVQINERLKDLPMQVLQQYANGMSPEVPPYLALGELQRRETAQKQMATAQGAAQGPQPSVKEQVEQKAGLMALQQMQQQQAAQQMQQPRGPMPAPAGVPQPEMQPQAMMARGGLAGIPVRRDMFEYAGGGIIAFQAGGQPKYETRYDKMNRENRETEERRKREFDAFNAQISDDPKQAEMREAKRRFDALSPAEKSSERGQQLKEFFRNVFTAAPAAVVQAPMPQLAPRPQAPSRPASVSEAQATAMAGPQAQVPVGLPDALAAASGPAGAKPPAPPVTRPPAATPPAPQAGLPEALAGTPAAASIPVSPDRAELEALMKSQRRQAPTAQGIIGDVNALMPEGMRDEAMKKRFADQRARAEARQAAYEQSKPTGLDDLIRVFGQAGQYKGLSGLAPAYTANQQQRRAEDLAMQKQQDELMTAIEGREYGADKDVFTARTGAMDKAQTLFGQSEKSILEAAAAKLGAEQGRLDKQAQLNMQRDLEQFKAIQDRELKTMDIDQRERESKRTDARSPAARAAEYVALKQKARDLRDKGQVAQADRLDAQAADMATIAGSGTAGVGAVRNAISERRLEMAALEKIMKDEAMVYSEEEKMEAAKEYRRLALLNSKESGGSPAGEVDKTNPLLK